MLRKLLLTLSATILFGSAAWADITPEKNDDGLYVQEWFLDSFLELNDDLEEADAEGKRLVVFFEQKGCIYCKKIHTEVLSNETINEFVRDNFVVVQLNLFGDREVTDFDGDVLSEKQLARKWGVLFTPTIMAFPEASELSDDPASGDKIAVAKMPGAFGKGTFLSFFSWVKEKGYKDEASHFQAYVSKKIPELREAGLLK